MYANVIKFLFTTLACAKLNRMFKFFFNNCTSIDILIANTKLEFRGSLPLRLYFIKDRFFYFYLYLITLIDNISIIPTLCYSASSKINNYYLGKRYVDKCHLIFVIIDQSIINSRTYSHGKEHTSLTYRV